MSSITDVDVQNFMGSTDGTYNPDDALLMAISANNYPIAEYLITNNLSTANQFNGLLIYITINNNYLDLLQLLLDNGADLANCLNNPLLTVSNNGYIDILNILLQNPNQIDLNNNSQNALFTAILNNHLDVALNIYNASKDSLNLTHIEILLVQKLLGISY